MNTPETDKFFATFADGEYAPSHAEYYARLQDLERERDEARGQRDRLAEVIEAASVLIAAKGRHNTMLAYNGLRDALQSITPKP